MKNKTLFFAFFTCLFLILTSCNSSKSNKYLKKLPAIALKYETKITQKEEEIEKCTKLDQAFKLSKELSILEDEEVESIKEYTQKNEISGPVNIQTLENTPYTIEKVEIKEVNENHIQLEFHIKIEEQIFDSYNHPENRLSIYYEAIDKKGNCINETATVAAKFSRDALVVDSVYILRGSWSMYKYHKLGDFDGIRELTTEEYKSNK